MKMSFHSHANKTHFHLKGFEPGLALKKRHKTTRKWPIIHRKCTFDSIFYLIISLLAFAVETLDTEPELSIYLFICLFVYLFIYLFIYLPFCSHGRRRNHQELQTLPLPSSLKT